MLDNCTLKTAKGLNMFKSRPCMFGKVSITLMIVVIMIISIQGPPKVIKPLGQTLADFKHFGSWNNILMIDRITSNYMIRFKIG